MPAFRNFRLSVVDENHTIVDVDSRKVSLHLKSKAATDAGPYENEYIFILMMSEDGQLVDEVFEFLDSRYTADFVAKLGILDSRHSQ